jgi:hypothetical protein
MAGEGLRSAFSLRTGEAHLRAVPAAHQLRMALGRLDDDVPIDPIVHELVHHVSANSIVNVALQYRWLALLRFTLSTPSFGLDRTSKDLAADVVAAEALLQPFAEGLAHFAEHDCAVADVARPVLTAYDALAIRLLSLRTDMTDRLADFRRASVAGKRTAAHVARRADVLSHPVRPRTTNEAYLLGYLVVKTAWNRYVDEGGDQAAGGFLEFVDYWFYEDWRLAALLAAPGAAGTVDAVASHLRVRTALLLGPGLADRVATYMADKHARQQRGLLPRGPEERTHGPFAGLGLTPDDVDAGSRALTRLHAERIGPWAPLHPIQDPVAVNVRNFTHMELVTDVPPDDDTARSYVGRNPEAHGAPLRPLDFVLELAELKRSLGLMVDIPVEIAVEGGRLVALRAAGSGWEPFPGEMSVGVDDGAWEVRLVGMVMSAAMPWSITWFLVSGLRFVGGWSHAADDDDDAARHFAFVVQYEESMNIATELRFGELAAMTSSRVLGDDTGIEATADAATARIGQDIRDVLAEQGWAALVAPPTTAPVPAIDGGLRNVLPGRLVRALALVGLVNASSLDRTEVADQLAAHGFDLDELSRACAELAASEGLRLLDVDEANATVRARV